jgi:hypothetical protein
MPPPKQDPKKKKRNPTTRDVTTITDAKGRKTRTVGPAREQSDAEVSINRNVRTVASDMQHEGNRKVRDLRQAVNDRYSKQKDAPTAIAQLGSDAAAVRKARMARSGKPAPGPMRNRSLAARKGALTRKARGK